MFIKLFIVALVVVALFLIGLKLRQLVKPREKEQPITGSCALETGELNEDGACAKCEIKDIINCPENDQPGSKIIRETGKNLPS